MTEEYEIIRSGLRLLYTNLLTTARNLPPTLLEGLGCPFLILPCERWCHSERRLMIVGKEPHDWGFDAVCGKKRGYSWPHPDIWSLADAAAYTGSVDALMSTYRTTMFNVPYDRAPFGQAWEILATAVTGDGNGDVVVSNVCLCNGTWEERKNCLNWHCGKLREEIRILQPTAVVFLSGPSYDDDYPALQNEFPGIAFEGVEGRTLRQFARLRHENLPSYSVRTYHPNYSSRDRRGKWLWIGEIANELKDG